MLCICMPPFLYVCKPEFSKRCLQEPSKHSHRAIHSAACFTRNYENRKVSICARICVSLTRRAFLSDRAYVKFLDDLHVHYHTEIVDLRPRDKKWQHKAKKLLGDVQSLLVVNKKLLDFLEETRDAGGDIGLVRTSTSSEGKK